MKKRLSKTLWYGTGVDSEGNPIVPEPATSPNDLEGLHEGELFLHLKEGAVTLWSLSADGVVVEISGGDGVDLSQYLLKSVWNKVWEIKTDSQGNEYIFGKLPVVTQYGITMYADGGELDLPSIYAGLLIDGSTLIRDNNGVLMINPDIDLGGASTWDELIGKPSWIGSTKPSYNYSEILQTPDLSVYATTEYLTAELKKYVTLNTEQTIAAHKNFLNGLSVGGLGITKSQDDVIYLDANLVVRGGITMYATDTVDVPSIIDSLPTASTSAKGLASFDPIFFSVDDNGNVSFIGSTGITEVNWTDIKGRPTKLSSFINDQGFASTLGELANVGAWADSAPTQGRLLYQDAGSSVWSYKNVSEFISETGAYLPLSGGTLSGNLNLGGNKINNVQTLQFASGVRGAANSGCSILGAFDAPYSATIQLGGYGTTPPSNATDSYYSFKIVDNAWTAELFMVNNDGKNVFGCKSAINDNSHVRGINLAGQLKFPSTTPTIPHPMIFGNGSYLTLGYGNVTNYGIVIASGEVRPNATDLFNLGLRSYRWKSIHTIDAFLGGYAQFDDMTGEGGMNTGAARIGTFDHTEGGFVIQLGKSATADNTSSGKQKFEVINPAWNKALLALDRAGNLRVTGGITMYSDQRKKTILNHVELTLQQIADAPLIEHYYNSDSNKTTHVGSIAQYWAELNDWFCKKDSEGFYTMEIQNAALASAISIARELVKYESKTDKEIRLLKDEVKRLKKEIKILKSA